VATLTVQGKVYLSRVLYDFHLVISFIFSKKAIEKVQQDGKVCVLDIEIEGVKQVKASHLNALYVFIQPPSIEELEKRLRGRKTETEESLQKRLNTAKLELEFGLQPGNFDIIIQNHNLKQAYHELRDFVLAHLLAYRERGLNVCVDRTPLNDNDFNHD
jgi:guanylate kinase